MVEEGRRGDISRKVATGTFDISNNSSSAAFKGLNPTHFHLQERTLFTGLASIN